MAHIVGPITFRGAFAAPLVNLVNLLRMQVTYDEQQAADASSNANVQKAFGHQEQADEWSEQARAWENNKEALLTAVDDIYYQLGRGR
jgi:hypothetical protein